MIVRGGVESCTGMHALLRILCVTWVIHLMHGRAGSCDGVRGHAHMGMCLHLSNDHACSCVVVQGVRGNVRIGTHMRGFAGSCAGMHASVHLWGDRVRSCSHRYTYMCVAWACGAVRRHARFSTCIRSSDRHVHHAESRGVVHGYARMHTPMRTSHSRVRSCAVVRSRARACTYSYVYLCVAYLSGVLRNRAWPCAAMHTSICLYFCSVTMHAYAAWITYTLPYIITRA
jgi:hypothetical protein